MRHERLYLADIIESADHIVAFLSECDRSRFDCSELIRSAVVQKLGIMGEAASHLSEALRAKNSNVAWRKIIAFRNILVHSYFGIDWDVVWVAATTDVPQLRKQVAVILAEETA